MTLRPIAIGMLSIASAVTPLCALPASAQYYDEFDSGFYDDLYGEVGNFNDPYSDPNSVNYGSTYRYNDTYGSTRYQDDYRYTGNTYQPQYTMPGFRCYYRGRDASCMNYSYRQSPSYYGGYQYGYNNYRYNNYSGYQNYNYGYNYGNRCGYSGC